MARKKQPRKKQPRKKQPRKKQPRKKQPRREPQRLFNPAVLLQIFREIVEGVDPDHGANWDDYRISSGVLWVDFAFRLSFPLVLELFGEVVRAILKSLSRAARRGCNVVGEIVRVEDNGEWTSLGYMDFVRGSVLVCLQQIDFAVDKYSRRGPRYTMIISFAVRVQAPDYYGE